MDDENKSETVDLWQHNVWECPACEEENREPASCMSGSVVCISCGEEFTGRRRLFGLKETSCITVTEM